MKRLSVQDRIATAHMDAMLHNLPHILFIADVHEAARREPVFLQDVKEDFNWRLVERASDLAYSAARVGQQRRIARAANL